MYGLALDFSQWQLPSDVITPEQVAAWKEAGVTKAIVGAGHHDPAIQQIRACADGGLVVEIYRYLFWGRPMHEQVLYAKSIARESGRRIERLWLDCEDAVIWSPDEMLVKIIEAKTASNLPIGIYTRRSWWEQFTGNDDTHSYLPLWDANYDGVADFGYFQPYGGWQKPAMKQYAKDVVLGGMTVDLNCYEASP